MSPRARWVRRQLKDKALGGSAPGQPGKARRGGAAVGAAPTERIAEPKYRDQAMCAFKESAVKQVMLAAGWS